MTVGNKILTTERIILYGAVLVGIVFFILFIRGCGKPTNPTLAINTHMQDSISADNKKLKKKVTDTALYYSIQLSNANAKAAKTGDSVHLYSNRIDNLKGAIAQQIGRYDQLRATKQDSAALVNCDSITRTLTENAKLVTLYQDKVEEMSNDLFSVSRIKDSIIDVYRAGFNKLFVNSQRTDSLFKSTVDQLQPRNSVWIHAKGLGNPSNILAGYGIAGTFETVKGRSFGIGAVHVGNTTYYEGTVGIKISFRKH